MPNILHTQVTIDRSYGGPARTVPALCAAVGRIEGIDVSLVSACTERSDALSFSECQFALELTTGQKRSAFEEKLNELCDGVSFDLLHDHGVWLPANIAAAKCSRKRDLPLVLTPRGMLEPWCLKHKALKKRLAWFLYQKRILNQVVLLHATANEEADNLRAIGLEQPIAVIPNGVEFPTNMPNGSADNSCKTALFVSRVHPKKGLVNLLKAWAEVRPEGWRMLIVGPDEGGHADELHELASELGLRTEIRNRKTKVCGQKRAARDQGAASETLTSELGSPIYDMECGSSLVEGEEPQTENANTQTAEDNDIVFLGPLGDEEKWKAYVDADLFILPTYSENFGVVVAEAMAAGLPVITTKGAPWKVLEEERCGWWIDVGIEPLATALKRATEIPDAERLEMGLRGKAVAYERFDWKTIGAQMAEVYEWVLGGGSPPPTVRLFEKNSLVD